MLLAGTCAAAQTAPDADCPVLDLDGPVQTAGIAGYIGAFEDPDWRLKVADLATSARDRFAMIDSNIPDFGYTKSKIWLRICVRNTTDDVADWRLYTHENFFQVYEVYLRHATGQIETLMDLQIDSPFSARPVADPELVAPMNIAPGERATIYISYWSGGSSQVDFSIETQSSFEDHAASKTARNFFFYGMMILLISVALGSLVVFRHRVFLAYCAYSTSALLFVMHGDGVAFQYLWPGYPLFNSQASVFTGTGLIVFGAVYARVFLQTPLRHPRIDKVLLAFILGTLALDAALFLVDPQLLKKLLIMVSLFSFLTFTVAGLVAYFSGYREVRFYTLAWLGVVMSSLLMNLRHVVGLEIAQETVHDSMRAVMVLDAMMMGLAIADRYNQLRQSRQIALEENLTAARHSLGLNRRLADLQTRHELAVEMSKSRDQQIQNVVHDLRQPLHALRLNVMNMNTGTQTRDPGSVHKMESAFTYLENLIAEHLEIVPGDTEPRAAVTDSRNEALDALGLQDILGAVEEMFQPDAAAKGLRLTRVPSSLDAPAEALVLTRILSNLVSNAIKYTESGGILIGTRRRGSTVRVEIHDTGTGMDQGDFDRAKERTVRLDKGLRMATGKGLGLAIAIDLAERHGMRIELSRLRRSGTGLVLVIPVATQPRRS